MKEVNEPASEEKSEDPIGPAPKKSKESLSLAKGKRLSPDQWTQAKADWRSGKYTLDDLSKKYSISTTGIHRRLQRHSVKRGEDQMAQEEKIAHAEIQARVQVAAKEEKALREKASRLKTFVLSAAEVTAKKLMAEMAKHSSGLDKQPLAAIADAAKAAKEVTIVLKNTAEIIEKVVPGEQFDPDDLPSLGISELTSQDIADLQAQQELQNDEMTGELSPEDFGVSEDEVVVTA
jgi:hypothetical protein